MYFSFTIRQQHPQISLCSQLKMENITLRIRYVSFRRKKNQIPTQFYFGFILQFILVPILALCKISWFTIFIRFIQYIRTPLNCKNKGKESFSHDSMEIDNKNIQYLQINVFGRGSEKRRIREYTKMKTVGQLLTQYYYYLCIFSMQR